MSARDIAAERRQIDEAVAGMTVCSMFEGRVRQDPDAVALRWKARGAWQELTWGEYGERVREATLGLHAIGFEKGEFALIMARNRPEHMIADLAVTHCGGTAVTLYNTLAPEQIEYIASHCGGAVAVLEDGAFLERFLQIRDRLPGLRRVVLLEPVAGAPADWCITWDELTAIGRSELAAKPDLFEGLWRSVQPQDLCALIYTSGTTGPPKGVMYTHRNVTWTCESSRLTSGYAAGYRWISYLPLAHVAERFATHWGGIYFGSEVSLCPDPAQLLEHLLDVRPTVFVGVPRVWEKFAAAIRAGLNQEPEGPRREMVRGALAAQAEVARHRERDEEPPPELAARAAAAAPVLRAIRAKVGLDRCEVPITSTAPIPVDVKEFFASLDMPLIEVWGMSELTGPATSVRRGQVRMRTVGATLDGVEGRIADDGELLMRGGNVMAGYYRDPEMTAAAIDDEGWMHSGDVGSVDERGEFQILDRKKELIITSSGKNISPANIEALLKHHPLIGQACVIGDGRHYLTALLVLDQEVVPAWARAHGIENPSAETLATDPILLEEVGRAVGEVNRHLSRIESIKKFRVLPVEWTVDSEELTPTLKMKRRVVNEKYRAEIDAMYAEAPASEGEATPA